MDNPQSGLDLGGRPLAGTILDRIRAESRDESEKGRWFKQPFMGVALQRPEFKDRDRGDLTLARLTGRGEIDRIRWLRHGNRTCRTYTKLDGRPPSRTAA